MEIVPPTVPRVGGANRAPPFDRLTAMDRTGRVMRSEVDVWAPQAGVTRRGLLVGAGVTAGALLVAGRLAGRLLPWRDWLSAAGADLGDTVGFDLPPGAGLRPPRRSSSGGRSADLPVAGQSAPARVLSLPYGP